MRAEHSARTSGCRIPGLHLMVLAGLAFCLAGPLWAAGKGSSSSGGNNSGGGGGGGGGGNSAPSVEDSQAWDFDEATHAINIQVNGVPTNISGADHDLNGVRLPDQTVVPAAPTLAIGMCVATGKDVNGGTDTGHSGITIDGDHNDAQVVSPDKDKDPPGDYLNPNWPVQNNLDQKWQVIEKLVEAARNGADYTIDIGKQGNPEAVSTTGGQTISLTGNDAHIGAVDDFKVVYATGSVKNGTWQEAPLHLSGQGTSYGLLVIEVDDPDDGGLFLSGQYTWVGLVIVVANKRITGNKAMVELTGGGQSQHVRGGVLVYYRNEGTDGDLYGKEAYRTNGNADLKWSAAAVQLALAGLENPLQVRSWRKLVQ